VSVFSLLHFGNIQVFTSFSTAASSFRFLGDAFVTFADITVPAGDTLNETDMVPRELYDSHLASG
jgi:hypothetical protein